MQTLELRIKKRSEGQFFTQRPNLQITFQIDVSKMFKNIYKYDFTIICSFLQFLHLFFPPGPQVLKKPDKRHSIYSFYLKPVKPTSHQHSIKDVTTFRHSAPEKEKNKSGLSCIFKNMMSFGVLPVCTRCITVPLEIVNTTVSVSPFLSFFETKTLFALKYFQLNICSKQIR